MTSFETIRLEKSGAIAVLTIARPETLNSLSSAVLAELDKALGLLEREADCRCLIITGEGRAFVAGADISEMAAYGAAEGVAFGERGAAVMRRIELLPMPVIAKINGFCLGGGCEMALACDIRIASDKAKFGQPEVSLGITPGFSGTQRLPRHIGLSAAKELIYTGRIIKAEEALRLGLVSRVVAAEELDVTVQSLAEEIAQQSPYAVRLSKQAINRGIECDTDTSLALENYLFGLCFAGAEQKEGMQAFLEKRKPNF